MKKLLWNSLLAALFCLLFTTPARAVEGSGYIFRLTESVELLSGNESLPEGVDAVYAPEGLFRTDDEALLRELEEAGLLEYAEPDWVVTLLDVPDDPGYTSGKQWELPALHMEYAWEHGITGAGEDGTPVRIGVVDSGVFAAHEDLTGANILGGTNYCVSEDSGERSNLSDSVGHGTFITGILAAATGNGTGVAGLAPQAEIVQLKCFTAKNGRLSDVLAAIYGGVDGYGCRVLSMSFGIKQSGLEQNLPENPRALEEAVAYAEAKGVILVAAVGNVSGGSTGNDPVLYPAGYDTVVGVGSVDREKEHSPFSYQNKSVFITAPGQGLYGLGTASETAYITGQGTSYAAPMAAAAAALALSVKPDMTPEEFRCLLRGTSEDLGEPGWDTAYGYGFLDIGGLLETVEKGWYLYGEAGERMLSVRLDGLTPHSTVWLVRTVQDAGGAQTGVRVTKAAAAADGSLRRGLLLDGDDADGTVRVLALDSAFCPLRELWSLDENSGK